MRRLIRWAITSLSLLSLLACLGTVWLWWRGKSSKWGASVAEVAALRAERMVVSDGSGLGSLAVGHWPEGAGVWAGDVLDAPLPHYSFPPDAPGLQKRTAFIGDVRLSSTVPAERTPT